MKLVKTTIRRSYLHCIISIPADECILDLRFPPPPFFFGRKRIIVDEDSTSLRIIGRQRRQDARHLIDDWMDFRRTSPLLPVTARQIPFEFECSRKRGLQSHLLLMGAFFDACKSITLVSMRFRRLSSECLHT